MKKAVRINEDLSKKIAPAIVRYAVSVGADIIVMEHLDFTGQNPSTKGSGSTCGGNATFRKSSCIKPTAMEFVYVSSTHETPAGWLSMVLAK